MGYEMMRFHFYDVLLFVAAFIAFPGTAMAQEEVDLARSTASPAVGVEFWFSEDSDGTSVKKFVGRALWDFENREKYTGIAVEEVWFGPATGDERQHSRIYLDLADHIGSDWRWRARVGSDGETLLGNAELRRTDWAQSIFIEREIVETDQGLKRGIYYTFIGASADLPVNDTSLLALTAGVQAFTGENVRLHVRGRYIHSLREEWGLSAHLDARYYHSTRPGEFDYFSPQNFVRLVPLLQMRRRTTSGWIFLAAGGVGVQQSTDSDWSLARYGQLRLESPTTAPSLHAFAEILHTNDSISGGTDYTYTMGRAGLTYAF
ncbi:hypothetical protein [Sphingomicrobium marinum]|uniref:hypothetical protein n=1 Tax=Sphingomicrobium marinum TaxID=1227950 RepID=UPI0022407045|nr:hypothetical protein [Sphingomicrobium marinum]